MPSPHSGFYANFATVDNGVCQNEDDHVNLSLWNLHLTSNNYDQPYPFFLMLIGNEIFVLG